MGGHLRILSANLFNGAADPAALAALVRAERPDVVAAQEMAPEQAEVLAELLPHGRLEPARNHRGMGLALAAPARCGQLELVHRNARVARLLPADWPRLERPVDIVNLHVSSPTAHPFRAQPRRRALQLRGLLAHLDAAPETALAVVGDFNATPLWPFYRRLATRLDDVVADFASAEGRRPARTWRAAAGRGPRLLRIDHCLARGLRAERVAVLDLRGSDHCALLVDLSLA